MVSGGQFDLGIGADFQNVRGLFVPLGCKGGLRRIEGSNERVGAGWLFELLWPSIW